MLTIQRISSNGSGSDAYQEGNRTRGRASKDKRAGLVRCFRARLPIAKAFESMAAEPDPRRKLSFSEGDAEPTATKSQPERLQVFVRVRPLSGGGEGSLVSDPSQPNAVMIRTTKSSAQGLSECVEQSFTFDAVFDTTATQQEVFETAMRPQISGLLAGRDTLTFAYGITNAGKTHTVQGGADEQRGMLPRALEELFGELAQHAEAVAARAEGRPAPLLAAGTGLDPACAYEVRASFLEVYGSDAYDLLAPTEQRGVHGEKQRGGETRHHLRV